MPPRSRPPGGALLTTPSADRPNGRSTAIDDKPARSCKQLPSRFRAIDHCHWLMDAGLMAVVKPRPLTKFDYWQLPETGPRYQLINGDLYQSGRRSSAFRRPFFGHGAFATVLGKFGTGR